MTVADTVREFPFSSPIEKDVLSVITKWPEKLDEAPNLTDLHFHGPGLAEYFRQVTVMIRRNGMDGVDTATLLDSLARSGTLDRMGGPSSLADIYTHAPSPGHFAHQVKSLNQFLARRMAIRAALEIQDAAFNDNDITALTEAISGPITQIHDTLSDSKAPSSTKSLVKNALQRYLDRVNGIQTPMGIETGITEIDYALKGLHPGRMWVIGAYPSGGKSALASQILAHATINGTPGVYVLLEMTEDVVTDRVLIQSSRAPALAFTDPKEYAQMTGHNGPTEDIRRKIEASAGKILQSAIAIRKPSNHSLGSVLATIRRAHREMGAKVAVVDYVQLISAGKTSNKEQEVSEISHSIQDLAGELGMHIIVLTQLNVDGDTKHGRVIEEDADAFLQIVQEMDKKKSNFKQHQHVLIAKDRHYSQGGIKLPLIFNPESIRFVRGFPEAPAKEQRARF